MTPSHSRSPLAVKRLEVSLIPDRGRVLIRPFLPTSPQRIVKIIARINALDQATIERLLEGVLADFAGRHQKAKDLFLERFEVVREFLVTDLEISEERRTLIGSYFTHEYSVEAAALFNPSIVVHPDQVGLEPGEVRFILSLRATGEGHISSISFRSGILSHKGDVCLNTPTRFVSEPVAQPDILFPTAPFAVQLSEFGFAGDFTRRVLKAVGETFTLRQMTDAVELVRNQIGEPEPAMHSAEVMILTLAQSNYQVCFHAEQRMSERVLFPRSPRESHGMEDLRLVCFTHEDQSRTYYGTYTAYDGRTTHPQLLATQDFLTFHIQTLAGPAVQNKGMALFPRQINGLYVMLSRQDNENLYLMSSPNLCLWHTARLIARPTFPWEFVQLGNCGSPLETSRGWLVITHGVGAMRKYSIGAMLLDLEDPTLVLGRTREPILAPAEDERDGYVPNVVYSCGALIHEGRLILPYAVADYTTRFASILLEDLLDSLVKE